MRQATKDKAVADAIYWGRKKADRDLEEMEYWATNGGCTSGSRHPNPEEV